jgi:hypothetical protein
VRLRLPFALADFDRRGFRTDRPDERELLEGHARSFLTGFNLVVSNWRAPHTVLREVVAEERGFAYEGAGMFAGLLDMVTAGRARALDRLLAGPGDDYVHLVHVGAGWLLTAVRVPVVVRMPRAPLLKWLALDGSGFGEVYFGGKRALHRRARQAPGPVWEARLAGGGRALWFAESADPQSVAAVIADMPPAARPALWSGVGLAAAYAGAVGDEGRACLAALAGEYLPHLAQGVVFAAAARERSAVVPVHTERACGQLIGVSSGQCRRWADTTSADLLRHHDVSAYLEWKSRLRKVVADRV